jgi:hypothetical protein
LRRYIASLAAAGLNRLIISLDSATLAEHERNRGLQGLERRLADGIVRARACGLPVQASVTVSRLVCYDELPDTLRRLGFDDGNAGFVCLACVAKRLHPRQLYDTDFGDEGRTDGEEGPLMLEAEVEVEVEEDTYTVCSTLAFPRKGGNVVKVERMIEACGHGPSGEWPDAIWDRLCEAVLEQTSWLGDYCRMHALHLIVDGKEVDLSAD